jgi:hypothetical protein
MPICLRLARHSVRAANLHRRERRERRIADLNFQISEGKRLAADGTEGKAVCFALAGLEGSGRMTEAFNLAGFQFCFFHLSDGGEVARLEPFWERSNPKKIGIMHLTNKQPKGSADFADLRRYRNSICAHLRNLRIKIGIVCERHNP